LDLEEITDACLLCIGSVTHPSDGQGGEGDTEHISSGELHLGLAEGASVLSLKMRKSELRKVSGWPAKGHSLPQDKKKADES
jgi:hypothetical protein